MIELNKIYNEDCLIGMQRIPDGTVDLVVTSPPYDNLRTYNNDIDKTWGEHVWKPIIKELYRVVKKGGVVVWVVNDATINGSETGTSFRQALYFMECGFNLHDTMLYRKQNPMPISGSRYTQSFEYMFVFSNGSPKTFNPIRVACKYAGQNNFGKRSLYTSDDSNIENTKKTVGKDKVKDNIFTYLVGSLTESADIKHPAMFPLRLSIDQIISWSNEGDTILDPFMGSGTTAIAAIRERRNYIGFEMNTDYWQKANERIKRELSQHTFNFNE